MPTSKMFWDRAAKKYAASPIKNMDAYHETMARTKAHLSPADHVLEVGCGTGSTALVLAENVKHIIATDISSAMIEIANTKKDTQKIENLTFAQATLYDIEAEPATFDAVLAFNLLHLLEDAPAAVSQIHRLLKPGGVFVSKTVCLAEKGAHLRILIAIMRLFGRAPHVSFLKQAELEEMMTVAKFDIIETGDYPAPSRFIVARKPG